ncbi:protein of unknown function (plasmid) [Rhodovastum atsumiense]|nr:protein of unknown function [Rhodovastum atsumiense]
MARNADGTETPLIFNNPTETEEMKRLRKIVTDGLGESEWELRGLSEGPNEEWTGVFRKKRQP